MILLENIEKITDNLIDIRHNIKIVWKILKIIIIDTNNINNIIIMINIIMLYNIY